MAAVGVVWVWALTALNATIQTLSQSWVRGRALSLYTLAFSGVSWLELRAWFRT
jgi:hypothetical protein